MKRARRYPVPTTDGVVLNKLGEVLLIKRAIPPFINFWTLPGGHVEYNEEVPRAVVREVAEETGLQTRVLKILGVYSNPRRDPRHHSISTVYLLSVVGGELLQHNAESNGARFFSLSKLPGKIGFDHRKILADVKKLVSDTAARRRSRGRRTTG